MVERLQDVGEFGLIARVAARLPQGADILLGPGDDAAVVAAPDRRVVATTDLLVEGRHFRLDWSSAYDVGRKAAAQNLADIAAMGARPTALLVGLAAPPGWPVADAEALADGLRDEADRAGASVAGGDVVRADALLVAVTALGDLGGRPPVTRAGAVPGDVLVLAGRVGHAAAGLAQLTAGRPGGDYVAAHRRPQPPYAAGPVLAAAGATAMIDVSDGLAADLGHVAEASGVRIVVDTSALADPALEAAAAELGASPLDWQLHGGDDHALAATVPPGAAAVLAGTAVVVGRVEAGRGVVDETGRPLAGGWDHFGGGT